MGNTYTKYLKFAQTIELFKFGCSGNVLTYLDNITTYEFDCLVNITILQHFIRYLIQLSAIIVIKKTLCYLI